MSRGPKGAPIRVEQVDTFASLLAPRRASKQAYDDAEIVAWTQRLIRTVEYRACGNAELLPQMIMLAQRLSEAVNTAIAVHSTRYAEDRTRGASAGECARAIGITPQSVTDRRALGIAAIHKRLALAEDSAGVTRLTEARREREARSAASDFALSVLEDYRIRRRTA